jgi:hypothetical protein
MDIDDLFSSRGLVESVDVLGNQRKAPVSGLKSSLKINQGLVTGVWFTISELFPSLRIEAPDQFRIQVKALRGRDIFDGVVFPKTVGVAKGSEPRLRRDASARHHDHLCVARDLKIVGLAW